MLCCYLIWHFATQHQSTASQSGHSHNQLTQVWSMCSWTPPRVSFLAHCSTPLPWLPVLFNIELPALWRKAAHDKLVEKVIKHDSWPVQPDMLNLPLLRLTSRKPWWLDLQPVDIESRWRRNWKSTQVVNSNLVCDPTIHQLGFWFSSATVVSTEPFFCIEHGHCDDWKRKWRLTGADLCPCRKS